MDLNISKVADNFLASIEKQKIFINPIEGHPIENQQIAVKDMYFIMLCVLVNTNTVINKNQSIFIERLFITSNVDEGLEDFLNKANNIDDDFIKILVNTLKNTKLKYNLILDMLALLGLADEREDKQIKLVSETALILRLSVDEVASLTTIAKSIIEQDSRVISSFIEIENNLLDNFTSYIENYYQGLISYNNASIHGIGETDNKISFRTLLNEDNIDDDKFISIQLAFEKELNAKSKTVHEMSSKSIAFNNYFMINEDIQLYIEDSKVITFTNCDFEKSFTVPIAIKNSDKVVFDNCRFSDMDNTCIYLENTDDILIKNCSFINCTTSKVIDFNRINSLNINNCLFEKISFKSLTESIITFDEWPTDFIITNNSFVKCKNMSGYGSLLFYTTEKPFKDYIVKIDNNSFEKCFSHTISKGVNLKEQFFKNNKFDNKINLFEN